MSDGTKIQWSHATWNPIRARRKDGQPNKGPGGWACQRVSAGCQNCYAATINKRRGTGFDYDAKGIAASDIYLDEQALTQPLHWRRRRKIFVCSMTDLFGEWVPDEFIDRVFAVMALTPQHTYQVLTKRPERMRAYMSDDRREEWVSDRIWADPWPIRMLPEVSVAAGRDRVYGGWPLPNGWLGTSVEDQERADERIPVLLATPAAVRFVSAEPLLSGVDVRPYLGLRCEGCGADGGAVKWCQMGHGYDNGHYDNPSAGPCGPLSRYDLAPGIDWVIVGGESGPGARPCDVEWIRSIVRQCQAAGVAVFYKQGGYHNRCPHDRKGGHFECFPDDLKVREFPNAIR